MDIILKYFNDVSWESVLETSLRVALILLLGWGVLAVVRQLLSRMSLKAKYAAEGEPRANRKTGRNAAETGAPRARLAVWITVLLVILKELGVEIGPILAGAGILGLAVGFVPELVRTSLPDSFSSGKQIRIGDVAVINGTGGLVEEINFRIVPGRGRREAYLPAWDTSPRSAGARLVRLCVRHRRGYRRHGPGHGCCAACSVNCGRTRPSARQSGGRKSSGWTGSRIRRW